MKLKISNLSKTYSNGVKALNNVNIEINQGMFGLLGPNGAGKSSLMRILATLLDPDEGTVTLGEVNVTEQKHEVRKMLGYLPQEFGFYPKVSALDLLNHFAVLKGISDKKERKEVVEALLHQTNLYEARKRYLGDFSGGMRQRFGIAQALLGDPKLVIVDEPTAGLDPSERNRFHNLLSEIGENIIVILSTHIVDDVRNLCSKMVVMNRGNVLLHGEPAVAIEELQGKIWKKIISKEEVAAYKDKHKVISTHMAEGKVAIHVFGQQRPEEGFVEQKPSLEDVYFSHVTHS